MIDASLILSIAIVTVPVAAGAVNVGLMKIVDKFLPSDEE